MSQRRQLQFAFVSKAYTGTSDAPTPRAGMRLIADTAHKHGVPVTWIVNVRNAADMRDELSQWHEQFGDAVVMEAVTYPDRPWRESLAADRDAMRKLLPWCDVSVVGRGGGKNEALVAALEDLGFAGLWGYCWHQVGTDGITDRGCPIGMYYVSRDSYKIPPSYPGKIAGVEWISRDCTRTFLTGNPCHFAPEPNGVIWAGLPDSYFADVLQSHIDNVPHNAFLPFILEEEAAEIDGSVAGYEEICVEMLRLLDVFFAHAVATADVNLTTVPEMVQAYRGAFRDTAPTLLMYGDKPLESVRDLPGSRPHLIKISQQFSQTSPKHAFYFDKDVQMVFREGQALPVHAYLYNVKKAADIQTIYPDERDLPKDARVEWDDGSNRRSATVTFTAPKAMPGGVVLWRDFKGWVPAPSNSAWIARDQVAFVKVPFVAGENRVRVEFVGA